MKQKIAKLSCLVLLMPWVNYSWALEIMDDASLAAQTGQDGVKVALQFPQSTISYDQAFITDKDGFGATGCTAGTTGCSPNKASLVMAFNTYSADQGIRLFQNNSSTTLATAPIVINVDADANIVSGTPKPVMNMNIALPSDMRRIRVNPFTIFAATSDTSIFITPRTLGTPINYTPVSPATTPVNNVRAGVTPLLRVNGQGIDIVFKSDETVAMNVQLGNTSQGHMFQFTSGSIMCIGNNAGCMSVPLTDGNNPIEIISKNSTTDNSVTSSLKLGFKLTASDILAATPLGFRLTGFYADIVNDGMTFGKDGATDKFDLTINNVIAGCSLSGSVTNCSSSVDPNIFNGLKNGSMGNFGVVGASISGFKMAVKGM